MNKMTLSQRIAKKMNRTKATRCEVIPYWGEAIYFALEDEKNNEVYHTEWGKKGKYIKACYGINLIIKEEYPIKWDFLRELDVIGNIHTEYGCYSIYYIPNKGMYEVWDTDSNIMIHSIKAKEV